MKHAHTRKADFDFHWPDPPLHVVLVHPEIPPNTGNIARLCAGTGSRLHLIEPLGFTLATPQLRRAGLDYWDAIAVQTHASWNAFLDAVRPPRLFLYSTGSPRLHTDARHRPGDTLVFGSETRGLPDELLAAHPDRVHGIPIQTQHVRSLNLSSATAIVVFEALRQLQSAPNA